METKPRCNGGASLFWMDGGQGKNKRHHLKEVGQWVKARRKADKNLRNYLKEVGHSVKVRRKADKDERNHFRETGWGGGGAAPDVVDERIVKKRNQR